MAHIYLCSQIFIIKNFKVDHLAHLEMRFLYWQKRLCIIYLRSQASFTRDLHQKIKSCIVTVKNFSNNSSYFFLTLPTSECSGSYLVLHSNFFLKGKII